MIIDSKSISYGEFLDTHSKNKKNKQQTILWEILLIKRLKKFYNIDYQNIDITYNKNGKPYILNSNIYYNISHSNDYVVCIFWNKERGIDIEKIIKPNDNIIKNIFTKIPYNKYFWSCIWLK